MEVHCTNCVLGTNPKNQKKNSTERHPSYELAVAMPLPLLTIWKEGLVRAVS